MNSIAIPHVDRPRSIIDQIYAIIDSKLQYIDYQTKNLIHLLIGDSPKTNLVLDIKSEKKSEAEDLIYESELLLIQVEKSSKIKTLLLFLRKQLCIKNASTIFYLLSKDQYKKYSQKKLKQLIEVELKN